MHGKGASAVIAVKIIREEQKMLEELKKQVYEANMELPRRGSSHIHGVMSVELTGKQAILSSSQVEWIMMCSPLMIW